MTEDEYLMTLYEESTGEKYVYENKYFPFSYISKLFQIDERDEDITVRLLDSAQKDINNYLGRDIFNSDTLSDELKEAVLALFSKKYSLCKAVSDYAYGDEIDEILDRKFCDGSYDVEEFEERFDSIPTDVLLLLEPYTLRFSSLTA